LVRGVTSAPDALNTTTPSPFELKPTPLPE
jgi:hypothetical protein